MSTKQEAQCHLPERLAPRTFDRRRRMSTQQDAQCHQPEKLAPQGFGTGGAE